MASLLNIDHPVPTGYLYAHVNGTYALRSWTSNEFLGAGTSVLQFNSTFGLYALFNEDVIIGAGLFPITNHVTDPALITESVPSPSFGNIGSALDGSSLDHVSDSNRRGSGVSTKETIRRDKANTPRRETPSQNKQEPRQQATKRKRTVKSETSEMSTTSVRKRRTPNIPQSNLPSRDSKNTPDQPLPTNMAAGPRPHRFQPGPHSPIMAMNQAPYLAYPAGQMSIPPTPPPVYTHPIYHPRPQRPPVMYDPNHGHLPPGYSQPEHLQPGYPQPEHHQPGYPRPGYYQPEHPQPGYPQPGAR
ncbi:hypothetical protein F5B18DRAFT_648029 [Nemania serpens]|nr:hypothetical protein F5B18DRAFT_648029 [Nemania serpens]